MNTLTRTLTSLVGLGNANTNVGKVERIASAVGGAALMAYSLKKGSKLGFLLRLAGGSLLARGATGHCEAYQALGINTAAGSRENEHVARDFHVEAPVFTGRNEDHRASMAPVSELPLKARAEPA